MHDKWDGTNLTYFLHGSDIFFSVDKEGWHDDGFMILRLVQNNISPHQLRQFTTVSWSRHLTFYLTHLSVFLQLEQSWANLHWSACLCAILASSSSHTCRQIIRYFMPVPGKQYLWVSGLDGVYQKKFVTGEKWLSSQNSSSNSKLLRNCRNKLWTIVKTIATKTYYSVDKINS